LQRPCSLLLRALPQQLSASEELSWAPILMLSSLVAITITIKIVVEELAVTSASVEQQLVVLVAESLGLLELVHQAEDSWASQYLPCSPF